MATLNLGRIKPVFRGAYSGSTAYVVDDIITHGNESFICIQAHGAGTQATSVTAYWTKLAAKGTDGTDVGTTITTQGDILYRDGSGLQRLAKPASTMNLQMTSGGVPSWAAAASGKVKQMAYTTYDAIYTMNPSSFTEANTGNRVTITPESTSNKLILEAYMPCQFEGGGALQAWLWYDVTGGAIFSPSSVTTASLDKGHMSFRGPSSDVNDVHYVHIKAIGACPRTTSSVFTPHIRSQGGNFRFNYGTHASHVNSVSIMTATEIETV